MSTYNELIKNFERIRSYMRDFYVYGFKSREAFQSKSARSYDDERRLERWPGNHMSFARTPEWKSVFISIDSGTDSGLLDESPHGLQEHGEDCGVYLACGGDYLSDQAHLQLLGHEIVKWLSYNASRKIAGLLPIIPQNILRAKDTARRIFFSDEKLSASLRALNR